MPIAAALIPVAIGAYQAVKGAQQAKKAQKALENQPGAAPSKAISDYYQMALNKYQAGPYNSTQYQVAKKGANQGLATGISGLQDRRSGVGGIGALMQQYQNNLERSGAMAQQQNQQQFSQLGQATEMKAGDEKYTFGVNSGRQRELYGMQAQGGNQLLNAGLSNIYSGLGSAGSIYAGQRKMRLGDMTTSGLDQNRFSQSMNSNYNG